MKVTLDADKSLWTLNMEGEYNGVPFKRRLRNKDDIRKFIESLDKPLKVIIGINDMSIYYDDCTLILKNYRFNKNRIFYKKVTNTFSPNTNIVDIVNVNVNKLKKTIKKKKIIQRTAAFAAAGFIAVGSVAALVPREKPVSTPIVYHQHPSYNLPEGYEDYYTYEEPSIVEDNFDITSYISLEERIKEVEEVREYEDRGHFNLCSKLDEYCLNKVVKHMEKNENMYLDAGLKYGVDPYLLESIGMAESSLNHSDTIPSSENYKGGSIGLLQISRIHLGTYITAYNYIDEKEESVYVTEDSISDLKTNIQVGTMMMQNSLKQFDNNIYVAIQAHNYGNDAMEIIINKYASETNKTREEVLSDLNDFGWMKYVDDMHYHPLNYFSSWGYNTYANNQYLYSVLGYYMGENLVNYDENNYYVYNLPLNTCETYAKNMQQEITTIGKTARIN